MTRVSELAEGQVVAGLRQARVIALAELTTASQAQTAAASLARGGIGCVEIVKPRPGVIRAARAVDGLLVGAGHVHTVEQAEAAQREGAHFATAATTNMEVVYACRELELPFFPGAATPTEIERLALLGVRTQRLFPAEPLGGHGFVLAMGAIFRDVSFLPAGGIGPELLRRYLPLPNVLAVASGGLVRPELLRAGNYDRIEWLARDVQRSYR